MQRKPGRRPASRGLGLLHLLARWQSGHAAACKAVYAGSIPTLASRTLFSAVQPRPAVSFLDHKLLINKTTRVQCRLTVSWPPSLDLGPTVGYVKPHWGTRVLDAESERHKSSRRETA